MEAVSYIEYIPDDSTDENGMDEGEGKGKKSVGAEAKALEVTLQCNAALAFLKAQAWAEAAQHAGAALKKEPVRAGSE